MKKNLWAGLAVIVLIISFTGCNRKKHYDDPVAYLKENWQSPEDYVTGKFKDYDYVFLGEYHRIKQNVDLVLKLIPKLNDNGIYTIAIEFGDARDQHLVDSIFALPRFDRESAKQIMYSNDPLWGYKEYIDIYKAAWEVNNKNRDTGKPVFRVVNLSAHYDPCKKGGAWKDIDPDVFMADVLFKEVISKGEKALVYSGNHHAFTRYHQPLYDFSKDSLVGYTNTRLGNIVYDSLKNRVFNIYIHAAWVSAEGWDASSVLPVNGAVDSIMNFFSNRPAGFDVKGTPFGKLTSNDSYYALGYDNFTLDEYCDGYVYQGRIIDYKPVTMEKDFITKDNIHDLKKYLECLKVDKNLIDSITVENVNDIVFEDIREHFKHLKSEY